MGTEKGISAYGNETLIVNETLAFIDQTLTAFSSDNGTWGLENGTLTWLGWTQRFLHYDVPRYSMYSFERVSSTFEMNHRYFEGVGNYSLFFVMFMLMSVILVTLSVLVLHVNIIDYNPVNVFVFKVLIFVFGFISFLATIMCFVGFTMVDTSLRKAVREQLKPALATLEEFNGHVTRVGDNAFGLLNQTRDRLTASADTGNWFQKLANNAKNAVALPVINKMMEAEPLVNQLKHFLKEILEIFQESDIFPWYVVQSLIMGSTMLEPYYKKLKMIISQLKQINLIFFVGWYFYQVINSGRSLLSIGMIYVIFTMFVCLWMASSSLRHAGTGPIICRLSTFVLMIWWLIGGAVMPVLLTLADICHHPVAAIAQICVYQYPDIDPNIIFYYGDCKEPNPLQPQLDTLYAVVSYIVGPLTYVIQLLGVVADSQMLENLKLASAYMTRIEEHGGCNWSGQQSKIMFSDICTNLIMGLAMFVLAAIIIAIGLTIAVMCCIKLREFKGWPKKAERLFPCPSTCHIHREFKEPRQPCQPKPCRSEIIWPPPKQYDRRITCPITCRGHDKAKAALDLRATCSKRCRGMKPSKPPPLSPVARQQLRKAMIPKEDKAAVCCIEAYTNNECVQEVSICKCHEVADPETKCDAEKCKGNLTSKGFLGNCGFYKCRFTKLAKRRKRKQKPKKPFWVYFYRKAKNPTKEPDTSKQAEAKKSVVKCGIERCKQTYKTAEIKKCQLSKCKKNKKGKMDGTTVIKPPPAEPINPVKPVETVKESKAKVKGGDSKNPKSNTTAKLSKNPTEGPTTVPRVSKPEDVASKKSRNSKKVK